MRLIVLASVYPPDLGAGAFRMQALVEALEESRDQRLDVDLITTRPNRYASHKAKAPAYEDRGWLRIHRIELPAHKSGMADQAKAYFHYAHAVRKLTRGRRWDLVFATSSRLMTAGLGAHIARRIGAPLYLDIRDLFTENMDELLARSSLRLLLPAFRGIERNAFRAAARINVVSEGFIPHVRAVAPDASISCFTNGVDDLFVSRSYVRTNPVDGIPLILYAGNMGDGQGLHRIIPKAAKELLGQARFRLIGDGGKRPALEAALAECRLTNVELFSPVSRENLIEQYREADILLLHLNDLAAFRKVLPSKIFEYAATGKPILAGVAGHAADFITREIPGAAVFPPCDQQALVNSARQLIAGGSALIDRASFRQRFGRRGIMAAMAQDILSITL